MTTFFISIIKHNDPSSMMGPYKSKDKVMAAFHRYVMEHYPVEAVGYSKTLGGDLKKGTFYTDDDSIEMVEEHDVD
jgi:hypothetical protein